MARRKRSGGEGGGSVAAATGTEFVLYQTDDGLARVQVRLHEGVVWLTQRDLADLYQVTTAAVSQHLRQVFGEGEVDPGATIKRYLTVRTEGNRSVSRLVDHYALPVVLAVGYRVRSPRGTQFRQWATARLSEYLVKGFTLDDERLKNPSGAGGTDYFDELLARIRDIRSSEKVFYRKVLEIYATSVDYDPSAEASQRFFATVQNKLHYAVHGQTAAEVIAARADAEKPNMGLTSWTGARPRRTDALVAKNYLAADELEALNRIVTAYLEFAELQALSRKAMHMADWTRKLDEYLALSEREVLRGAGAVSHADAAAKAQREFDQFRRAQDALPSPVDDHFAAAVRDVEALAKRRPRKPRR
ncbi:MAG: virulence RhuM family protein [Kofleriaceae bacterium]